MRLDEYGRWVSDDGAYIWDETAQVWQPATVSLPLAPPPSPLGGADPASGWSSPSQPADASNTGSYELSASAVDTGGLGTGAWPAQPADPLDSGAYPLDTGGLYTGGLYTGEWQANPGADPLTDTGASSWAADSGTGAHALWQPADADADSAAAWAPAAAGTQTSPSGATPLWSADPGVPAGEFASADGSEGYGATTGYAPTGAYPGGQWPAGGDLPGGDLDDGELAAGELDDDNRGFTPSGATARSGRRRVPGGRLPLDDDLDDGLDDPRSARFAALTRSRPALLGIGLVAVMLLGFLTFALLGGDGEQDEGQQVSADTAGRYEEEFRRSYLDTCIQASDSNAADYCSCTLDKFEADYTQDEFVRLSTDPNGAESREAVRLVTESCRAGQ